MISITVTLEDLATRRAWVVKVGSMEIRFATEAEARAYAGTLRERIRAPHGLTPIAHAGAKHADPKK
ncbi:hypothetical protein GCM10009304_08340 [Pseudomonas matsuisoli]|uniref:DUF2188 domain-containing protein n=1 Tax=Pseudomonas matsuisoli TaxID=1515666 RepID=A0A917UTG8_9PSED|nr:hypothetical protein GCM10009304_08340 [Pseudomonas matsuisoli]